MNEQVTRTRCGDGYGSTMSSHRVHHLGLASLALLMLVAACGGGAEQAGGATQPGASAGVPVSPSTTPSASAMASKSKTPKAKRSASASATASESASATSTVTPPKTLPTTAVPTGRRPDPERPKKGQDFVVSLVEKSGTYKGEVNLSEVLIDRAPKDPELADRAAVLLYYTALNTGTKTYRGNDPVGDRFFVRSNDQVMESSTSTDPMTPTLPVTAARRARWSGSAAVCSPAAPC